LVAQTLLGWQLENTSAAAKTATEASINFRFMSSDFFVEMNKKN
jgi:hypothetical protein